MLWRTDHLTEILHEWPLLWPMSIPPMLLPLLLEAAVEVGDIDMVIEPMTIDAAVVATDAAVVAMVSIDIPDMESMTD